MCAGDEQALKWTPASTGVTQEGSWTCWDTSPTLISQTSLHPCASNHEQCCGRDIASVGIQYVSTFHDTAALVELTYEVWPSCGDGLYLSLNLIRQFEEVVVHSQGFVMSHEPPHRKAIEKVIAIYPGDTLLLLVDPGTNHDCDGVYVHEFRLWQSSSQG